MAGGTPFQVECGETLETGDSLKLLPEVTVRRLLADRPLSLRLLTPPYRALGVGVLRVLSVAVRGTLTELVAGYERYERLASPDA